MSNIIHAGFISSIKYDNLTPWYTTSSENEVIEFRNTKDYSMNLNSLLIEAETVGLYIRILPSDYCLYVPPFEAREYKLEKVTSIQIMNPISTKLRWSGQFY